MPGPIIRLPGIAIIWCVMSIGAAAHAASADGGEYPSKPVRIVVGFSPSGGGDIMARIVAQKLSHNLRQSVIVENRPGAGGSIGAAFVARSAPDGYNVLVVTSSYAVISSLYKDLSFDPIKDFAAVGLMAEAPLLLVVHPSLPVQSVRELVAFAKARPGALNYASGGEGTSGYLAGELFKSLAAVKIVHVPYKGAGPALVDVISGQVHMNFVSMLSSLPHVRSGKLRALAVTSAKRSSALPQLPTVAEADVKGYRRTTWYGMLAPAHTPAAIVNRLSTETAKAVKSPDIKERFMAEGAEPQGGTPNEFYEYLISEIALARKIVEQAGLQR